MRAVLWGANGAMGKLIGQILRDEVVGKVSVDGENGVAKTGLELGDVQADMVIDFSHHTAIADVLDYAKKHHCTAVIGTTGHTPEEKALITAAANEIPVFYSGNMSLGIAVLCRLARMRRGIFLMRVLRSWGATTIVRWMPPVERLICCSTPSRRFDPMRRSIAAGQARANGGKMRLVFLPCGWAMW